MEKKIVSSDLCRNTGYKEKSSSAFIANYTGNGFVVPEVIKIEDDIAWAFYQGNEWVNAVVTRIIQDTVKHRPSVAMRNKKIKMKPKHEAQMEVVNDFLFNPNENTESFRDIRTKYLKDMLVVGRGAVEKVLNPATKVLQEIYAVQAKNIKLKMDKHGNLLDVPYILKSPKGEPDTYYSKEEMFFTILRPTTQNVYGEKPLDALANTVASDLIRAAYNTNFFVNGAEASGILSLKDMSKGELGKFKDYWAQNHKGFGNSHRVVAVNVPIEYIRMAITNKDMEFIQYGVELKSKIYAVFSMQPFIMGDITSTTGKLNSSEQKEIYMDGAIMPLLDQESYVYTTEILHKGFGFTDLEIVFPESTKSDRVTQDQIDRDDITVGMITINEVRESRGLAPVKWGDAPIVMPGGKLIDPATGQLIDPKAKPDATAPKGTKKPAKGKTGTDTPPMAKGLSELIDELVYDSSKHLDMNELVNSVKGKIGGDYSDTVKNTLAKGIVAEMSVVCQTSKNIEEILIGFTKIVNDNKGLLNA